MTPASKKTGDEAVGRRIAERRAALRMSRDELAADIGASYALVAQIETGWRMPSYEKQRLIARSLGASLDELFGESDDGALAEVALPVAAERPDAAGAPTPEGHDVSDQGGHTRDAFPVGAIPVARSASLSSGTQRPAPPALARAMAPPPTYDVQPAASTPPPPAPAGIAPAKPSFDDAVANAAQSLRDLPPARRLDALSRLQLIVMREVADEERRRVGGDRTPAGWITALAPDEVFVFGSDREGRHAGGASRLAYERFGAEWGEGRGHHGQSYAVVTTEGLGVLHDEIADFLTYARARPDLRFLVTPLGTGTAGYRADEIAPLFAGAPANVVLPAEFAGG